jgi:hypothetical protein
MIQFALLAAGGQDTADTQHGDHQPKQVLC